ncbi:ParB/RepB/Spo0J family partition protein [Chiayiivirga flava]|uniref:Probable chromosome-partitioning protein ParB n=1 Tax=Chiayiivirga flava TaxID=659595 RepID=A0A7W8D4S8_9GAMM|nr:ParB/RepB/Spo0J family partition protein [Chiayiivirga flava]MBB5207919.1 ParB family chromosome partitioning protein [Chiayiivirga flava]
MASKKPALGRGLSSLIREAAAPSKDEPAAGDRLGTLPIEALQPGKYQPRSHMDKDRLAELAESIRAQGMIQPIIVRGIGAGAYEIIAGERRWRAAQLAQLRDVPVVIREIDDHTALAMALIENIQREDLNPLEEALALQRLIDEFSLTHQQAAEAVGRSRAAVSNLLRLLELPEAIRAFVERRELEMGHARALLTLPPAQALALAQQAAADGWSVREIEKRVQQLQQGPAGAKPVAKKKPDADIATLERELGEQLNARVTVKHGRGGKGQLIVQYHSLDELEGILARVRR